MNDTFWTGVIIFSFAYGSVVGAAAGWAFFGLMLMVGGIVQHFKDNPKIYSGKDKD